MSISTDTTTYMGRRKLLTEYLPNFMRSMGSTAPELNSESIPKIFKDIWYNHFLNGVEVEYLLNYYRGSQDILDRVKVVRPDVDNRIVFNHALAVTRDIVGYTFGKPIRYVHRTEQARDAVRTLNEMVEAEDKFTSDQELATYASIAGTAYRGIFADVYGVEDDVPFSVVTLDPRTTFVVYSTEIGNPPVFACSYYSVEATAENLGKMVYLIYTHDMTYRYESTGSAWGDLKAEDLKWSGANTLGLIPIVEYPNNAFLLGDWEIAKTLLDAINLVGSDCVNELEQFVNSILVAVNCDLKPADKESLQEDKIISIVSSKELPADLKYIAEQADSTSTENLRRYLLDQMRIIVGVPSRDSRSGGGGDTGDSVYLRDGFQDLEIVARTKETFFKRAERATMKLILKILAIDGQLKDLKPIDVDVRFSRNTTDNILNKATALSTLHATRTLDPIDSISLVGITTDPDELARRGETYWLAHPEETAVAGEEKTVSPDNERLKQKVDR